MANNLIRNQFAPFPPPMEGMVLVYGCYLHKLFEPNEVGGAEPHALVSSDPRYRVKIVVFQSPIIRMFLSRLLCSARWTPGRQWAGKNRKTVKVTRTMKKTVLQRQKHAEQVRNKQDNQITCSQCKIAH